MLAIRQSSCCLFDCTPTISAPYNISNVISLLNVPTTMCVLYYIPVTVSNGVDIDPLYIMFMQSSLSKWPPGRNADHMQLAS